MPADTARNPSKRHPGSSNLRKSGRVCILRANKNILKSDPTSNKKSVEKPMASFHRQIQSTSFLFVLPCFAVGEKPVGRYVGQLRKFPGMKKRISMLLVMWLLFGNFGCKCSSTVVEALYFSRRSCFCSLF